MASLKLAVGLLALSLCSTACTATAPPRPINWQPSTAACDGGDLAEPISYQLYYDTQPRNKPGFGECDGPSPETESLYAFGPVNLNREENQDCTVSVETGKDTGVVYVSLVAVNSKDEHSAYSKEIVQRVDSNGQITLAHCNPN